MIRYGGLGVNIEGVLHNLLFSAGLILPLLVNFCSFSSLHIICHKFGGEIWEAAGDWMVPPRCGRTNGQTRFQKMGGGFVEHICYHNWGETLVALNSDLIFFSFPRIISYVLRVRGYAYLVFFCE